MTDEYLFISDCHLDPGRPQTIQVLVDFLQTRAATARRLYILGDLFEVWLGDDDPAQGLLEVITALQQLSKSCDVFFMAGNRDFLLGEAFADRVGMTLLEEPLLLRLGQQQVALMHGDTLCTKGLAVFRYLKEIGQIAAAGIADQRYFVDVYT